MKVTIVYVGLFLVCIHTVWGRKPHGIVYIQSNINVNERHGFSRKLIATTDLVQNNYISGTGVNTPLLPVQSGQSNDYNSHAYDDFETSFFSRSIAAKAYTPTTIEMAMWIGSSPIYLPDTGLTCNSVYCKLSGKPSITIVDPDGNDVCVGYVRDSDMSLLNSKTYNMFSASFDAGTCNSTSACYEDKTAHNCCNKMCGLKSMVKAKVDFKSTCVLPKQRFADIGTYSTGYTFRVKIPMSDSNCNSYVGLNYAGKQRKAQWSNTNMGWTGLCKERTNIDKCGLVTTGGFKKYTDLNWIATFKKIY